MLDSIDSWLDNDGLLILAHYDIIYIYIYPWVVYQISRAPL